MTTEELLIPRFKVIADYPNSILEVGRVFTTLENGVKYISASLKVDVRNFPYLFKKLEWWEEREEKDMPEYIKFIRQYHRAKKGEIKRITRLYPEGFYVGETESYLFSDNDVLPATKEEYQQYQQSIKIKNQ